MDNKGPNIIHNLEESKSVPPYGGRAFDFSQFLLPEELKNHNQNKKLTLDQFARKVSSKRNLMFALGVKGKVPAQIKFTNY